MQQYKIHINFPTLALSLQAKVRKTSLRVQSGGRKHTRKITDKYAAVSVYPE